MVLMAVKIIQNHDLGRLKRLSEIKEPSLMEGSLHIMQILILVLCFDIEVLINRHIAKILSFQFYFLFRCSWMNPLAVG